MREDLYLEYLQTNGPYFMTRGLYYKSGAERETVYSHQQGINQSTCANSVLALG